MTTHRKFWEHQPRTDYYEYFNDFLNTASYAAADWTITTTEGGSGDATEAISVGAGPGGVLVITNDDAATDVDYLQNKLEVWQFQTGKVLEFECRFKVSDATNTGVVLGLQITDTTPLAVSDGVFFRKSEDDLYPDLVVCRNATETVVALPDPLANDTWVKLGFYYDGGDTVQAYVNDVRVAAVSSAGLPITSPLDLAELLAISIGLQNSSAAAHVLSIDYIRVRAQR